MALTALKLLTKATAPASGEIVELAGKHVNRTYQANLTAVDPCTADVSIEVSLDRENWMVLGHITLADDDVKTDGFVSNAAWLFTRATLNSITGVGASVDVSMAY